MTGPCDRCGEWASTSFVMWLAFGFPPFSERSYPDRICVICCPRWLGVAGGELVAVDGEPEEDGPAAGGPAAVMGG